MVVLLEYFLNFVLALCLLLLARAEQYCHFSIMLGTLLNIHNAINISRYRYKCLMCSWSTIQQTFLLLSVLT